MKHCYSIFGRQKYEYLFKIYGRIMVSESHRPILITNPYLKINDDLT